MMMARYGKLLLMAGLGLSLFSSAEANVSNGDFSAGLAGWNSDGDVTVDALAEEAILGDDGIYFGFLTGGALFQAVNTGPGTFVLEFDFLNALASAPQGSPFVFPDTFFASLYFTDDLGSFDIVGGMFDDVLPLFDLDHTGPFGVTGGASLTPSTAKGTGWSHFSLTLSSVYTFAVPAFELADLDFIAANSSVRVDNVAMGVASVPAPASLGLLGLGLGGMVLAFRTRRRQADKR
jgi:hypothetical protein